MKKNHILKSAVSLAVLLLALDFAEDRVLAVDVDPQKIESNGKTPKSEVSNVTCNIGSVSKTFSSLAVLQLAKEGKIDIDKPLYNYLPEFSMADDRYKDITVRMLMNHTSGIMGTTYGDSFLYEDNDMVSHDRLLEKLRTQRLKATPGEYSAYCNDGFWLLEILVEKVSGMSFTDYVAANISAPLGLEHTGTPVDMFQNDEIIDIYIRGKRMGHEYVMDIGSGGVISTASDLCQYGTIYFMGNNCLISDEMKEEMFTNYAQDSFEAPYGLGWDDVSQEPFGDSGVRVVSKGGSTAQQFASLMVAPDEKISVAVLSSGANPIGSTAMARVLMKTALSVKGIEIKEEGISQVHTADHIPFSLEEYAGYYASGSEILRVDFPEERYMTISSVCKDKPDTTEYLYTENGNFVRMDGEADAGLQDNNQQFINFVDGVDGAKYMAYESNTSYEGFGVHNDRDYYGIMLDSKGEKADEYDGYSEYEGQYCLYSGKYSNTAFGRFNIDLVTSEECPGYLVDKKGVLKVMKIADEGDGLKAYAVTGLPGSAGRDLNDIRIEKIDGKHVLYAEDAGLNFIKADSLDMLSTDVNEITTTKDEALWYDLGETTKGYTMTIDKSENTSVYVYDKFDNVVYSSYMMDWPNEVALPSEGRVMFAGDSGERISLSFQKK